MTDAYRMLAALALLALVPSADAQQLKPSRSLSNGRGIGVDSRGGPVVDPTENVKELVQLSIKRLDDLRIAEAALQAAELRAIKTEMALRAEFAEKLSIAETGRLNAIRAVDVNAVSIANERATSTASTLAEQLTAAAETQRGLVESSAKSLAAQQETFSKQIEGRLAQLEKTQYTTQGLNQPQLSADTADRLAMLEKGQYQAGGRGEGLTDAWSYVIAAVGLVTLLLGLFLTGKKLFPNGVNGAQPRRRTK